MLINIFTGSSNDLEWKTLSENCFRSAVRYASGRDNFKCNNILVDPNLFSKPTSWIKIKAFLDNYSEGEFFLWLDADSHIYNMDYDVELLINNNPSKDFFIASDQNGPNFGVFIARFNEINKRMFQWILSADECINTQWEEQTALHIIFKKNEFDIIRRSCILKSSEFNCYYNGIVNIDGFYYNKNIKPFVRHMPGFNLAVKQQFNLDFDITNGGRDTILSILKENSTGVEVGCYLGDYADILKTKCRKLYLVDPYIQMDDYIDIVNANNYIRNDDYKFICQRFSSEISAGLIEMIRKKSLDAVRDFQDESLDFVYLDANHRYSHVLDDLNSWWSKVKPGGLLCGHDYQNSSENGSIIEVKSAVTKFLDTHWPLQCWTSLEENNRSFFIRKP